MNEDLQPLYNEFIQNVQGYIEGNQETIEACKQWLEGFFTNQRIGFLLCSSYGLDSVNEDSYEHILLLLAFIKQFLNHDIENPEEKVEKEWLSFEYKDLTKNAIVKNRNSDNEGVRNMAAKCLSMICEYDPEIYNECASELFTELQNQEQPPTDFPLKFFKELFDADFFSKHKVDNMLNLILQLINECFRIYTWDAASNDIKILSLKLLNPLISHSQNEINAENITQIISYTCMTIQELQQTNQIENPLYNSSFYFLKTIYKVYYNIMKQVFREMAHTIFDPINCQIPIEQHSPETHNNTFANLMFLIQIARFEHLLYKEDKSKVNFILLDYNLQQITECLIHLLMPANPNDQTIEDPENSEPSFLASSALCQLCKIPEYFKIMSPILFGYVNQNITNNTDTTFIVQNTVLLCLLSVTSGPRIEGDEIYQYGSSILIERYLNSENRRLVETSLYVIYKIIKKYGVQSPEDLYFIMNNAILPQREAEPQVRLRCSNIITILCENVPESALESMFDITIQTIRCLTDGTTPDQESTTLVAPFDSFYRLIKRLPETEEVRVKLLDLILRVDDYFPQTHLNMRIGRMIVISTIANKLKKEMSQYTQPVFDKVLTELISLHDFEFWKEGLVALLKILDTGSVSSEENSQKINNLMEMALQSYNETIIYEGVRVIGKFYGTSVPCFVDESPEIIDNLFNLATNIESSTIFKGIMFALHDITYAFSEPNDDTINSTIKLLSFALSRKFTPDIESAVAPMLTAFSSLFLSRPDMSKVISDFHKEIIKYIEFISKNRMMTDTIFIAACNLIKVIGTNCKRSKLALNRSIILNMLNERKTNLDPKISFYATKTYDFVTML